LTVKGVLKALGSMRRLGPWIRKQRKTLWIAVLVSILGIAAEVARPWPVKVVIDQVILGQSWSLLPESLQSPSSRWTVLFMACGALLVLAGLSGFLTYTRTVLLAQAGQQVVARLRMDLHRHLMLLSLGYHSRQRSGDLLVRVSGDASMMKPLLADGIFDLVQQLLMAIGVLCIMLMLDPLLALAAALTIPTVAIVTKIYGSRLRTAAKKQRKKEGKIAQAVGDSLRAIPVIQAFSLEKEAAKRFARQNKKSLKAGVAASRLQGAMSRWTELALASGTALILLLGTYKVIQETRPHALQALEKGRDPSRAPREGLGLRRPGLRGPGCAPGYGAAQPALCAGKGPGRDPVP
jgi:ABC-type multidrug transport system fused ATPase/permease subunit